MDRAGEVRRTRHKALVCPQRTETTKPPPREPTARAGNSQPETPQMEGLPTHVNPGQPQQVTGDGLHPETTLPFVSFSSIYESAPVSLQAYLDRGC